MCMHMGILSGEWYIHTYVYIPCWIHMWQSRVEIEHCSVAYFDHITAFEAL